MRMTIVLTNFDGQYQAELARDVAFYGGSFFRQEDRAIVSVEGDVTTLMCVVAVCDKYS